MRIISGSKRGKKILLPDPKFVRPLRDYVKENIFNLIAHNKEVGIDLVDKVIFDIFSGSGSFGIECLSRGAKYVYFIEKNNKVCKILSKNLTTFNKNSFKIFEKDFFDISFYDFHYDADMIFLDPPYKIKAPETIFNKILEIGNSLKGKILIFHTFKKNNLTLPKNFIIKFKKNYGLSEIYFLKINI